MKKTVLALCFLVAACGPRTSTTTTSGPVGAPPSPTAGPPSAPSGPLAPGATSPRAAVEQFLAAVRAQDIQAMAVIFGTSRGPSRDNMDRDELEKRLIILQCYFNHDKSRILGEVPGESGHRVISTELTRGANTRTPRFYAITGPSNRWYVDNMEIAAVRDFCRDTGR